MSSFQLNRHHSEDCGSDSNDCDSKISCVVLMEAKIISEKLDDCIKLWLKKDLRKQNPMMGVRLVMVQ